MEMQLKHLVLAHHPVLLKKKKKRERERERKTERKRKPPTKPAVVSWAPDPPASAFRVAATTGV
jgi:hypothetical protein